MGQDFHEESQWLGARNSGSFHNFSPQKDFCLQMFIYIIYKDVVPYIIDSILLFLYLYKEVLWLVFNWKTKKLKKNSQSIFSDFCKKQIHWTGWQKTRERGSAAPTKSRHVARIVILAAKNIIGEKYLFRKLVNKMSRMKTSTDA